MAFNPQATYRGADYLYQGMASAGDAIASGIKEGRQNEFETTKARKIANILGYDKSEVDNMGRAEVLGLIEGDFLNYARNRQQQQDALQQQYGNIAQNRFIREGEQFNAQMANNQFLQTQNQANNERDFALRNNQFIMGQANADRNFEAGQNQFAQQIALQERTVAAQEMKAQASAIQQQSEGMKTEISKLHNDAAQWRAQGREDIAQQVESRAQLLSQNKDSLDFKLAKLAEILGTGKNSGANSAAAGKPAANPAQATNLLGL